MKTLKTLLMALTLVAAPSALLAQAAPAPVPAAPVVATETAAETGGTGTATPLTPPAQQGASAAAPAFPHQQPTPDIGQPKAEGVELQAQVTEVGEDAAWMHDVVLMPIITVISLFVLALLLWVIIRYRAAANPTPSRTSHNTFIEVLWTLVPVLILLVIAVPSIRLLAKQYAPPKADLTVKVIGNQWYWTYQYPDNGDFEIVSNMLPDEEAKRRGEPRLLAVDERMVVPAGKVIKLIVTSNDVIHSFGLPAFWQKMDAVPGRLNETWFKTDRVGVYYGQCSELCGARHGYMPIAVEVVPPAQFAAWVASKGGTMPGAKAPANPDATAASPAAAAQPGSAVGEGAAENATPAPAVPGTAAPATTSQPATAN